MLQAEPIGWANTGLPLLILGALAVLLPQVLVPAATRSQGEAARGIVLSALAVLAAGVAVFAGLYAARGAAVGQAAVAMPVATALFFLRLSGLAALFWGPVLALVWLGKAQGVERRRGEDAMREGRE